MAQILSPLLPLLLLLAAAAAAATTFNSTLLASAWDNTTVTFPLPSRCPTRCGDITFQYPFGIGHECFRPGFGLICDATTNHSKLLLDNGSDAVEVMSNIYSLRTSIEIKAPVAIMGVEDNSSYFSWTIQANRPYNALLGSGFWVTGCNATASLVDLTSNKTLGTCVSTCADTGSGPDPWYNVTPYTCNGIGCCYILLGNGLQSYGIKLSRSNQATKYASSVKAFVGDPYSSTIDYGVPVAYLTWYINDGLSCNKAKDEKSTYACLSRNSDCQDVDDDGYSCTCSLEQGGNPYVPDGCYYPSPRALPSDNCRRQCGNISIPFPFGLEDGCYKDTFFAMTCNETFDPPILRFVMSGSRSNQVIDIKLDEGQVELEAGTSGHIFFDLAIVPFEFFQQRATFEWVIDYKTCESAMQNTSDYACRSIHSNCFNRNITYSDGRVDRGYVCKCLNGFRGNPYLPDGCQDIDECQEEKYVCQGVCVNTVGSYICTSHKKQSILLGVIVGVCVGFGTLVLVAASIFATWKWKKVSQKRIRRRNFSKNHGLLLQQLIASTDNTAEKTKIFSLEDLEKATNNFDNSRIIGSGGHGTVYKGILVDQRVVAIKKSKISIRREIDDFINEVAILSHINHRNVVKLFGCCLETEVPLLIYEFISNGTLFDHLHGKDYKTSLSWLDRLRIASEAAGALAYLHSSASISIFHRDMKSSNILLDDYLTSKVSDFGASRLIPLDKTHILTGIQGTFGYLDPEYYQTCELTEKSDVYSFGVILLELITGERPISQALNGEERILVMKFLQALKENHHFELMDARVKEEATMEELDQVGKLAARCLKLKGRERPTMKEVEMKLRFLWKVEPRAREKRIAKADQETMHLLSDISGYDLPRVLVEQSSSQNTRNYSLELEFMNSVEHPR